MNQPIQPSLLSFTRAIYSTAKEKKKLYWKLEVCASTTSMAATLIPDMRVVSILIVSGVIIKVFGKATLSEAKGLFRRAERGRRYDFENRCLGWPLPPRDRADVHLSKNDLHTKAAKWAKHESEYFSAKGASSPLTFLSHLTESIFWTEQQIKIIGKTRWKQFLLSASFPVLVLVIALICQPDESAGLVLKLLAITVSLLVSVDFYGEAKSFQRGEKELSLMLDALAFEGRTETPNRDEVTRIFIEYNCVLADIPMWPDEIYEENRSQLNAAWDTYRQGIPALKAIHPECNEPSRVDD